MSEPIPETEWTIELGPFKTREDALAAVPDVGDVRVMLIEWESYGTSWGVLSYQPLLEQGS